MVVNTNDTLIFLEQSIQKHVGFCLWHRYLIISIQFNKLNISNKDIYINLHRCGMKKIDEKSIPDAP